MYTHMQRSTSCHQFNLFWTTVNVVAGHGRFAADIITTSILWHFIHRQRHHIASYSKLGHCMQWQPGRKKKKKSLFPDLEYIVIDTDCFLSALKPHVMWPYVSLSYKPWNILCDNIKAFVATVLHCKRFSLNVCGHWLVLQHCFSCRHLWPCIRKPTISHKMFFWVIHRFRLVTGILWIFSFVHNHKKAILEL